MSRGQALLNRMLGDADHGAGVAVVYERPGQFTLPLTCWVGQEQVTAATVGTTLKPRREDSERDYLIPVAALVTTGGEALTPKRGDRITESLGGADAVFEITPREGEPAWRFSDQQRTRVRVHCKKVA